MVSATDPHGRLMFSRPEPLLFYSSSSSIDLTRLSGPRSSPTTTQKIWQCRESNPRPLYLQPETLTTRPQRRSSYVQGGSNTTGTDLYKCTNKPVPVIYEPPCMYPTICNVTQFIYFCKLLYMFRVVFPPIIRSTLNCIYNIRHLSHRYCWNCLQFQLFHDNGRQQ